MQDVELGFVCALIWRKKQVITATVIHTREATQAGYEIQKWSIGFTIVVHGLRVVRLTDDLTDVNTYLMNLPINSLIIACHARIFNSNCTAITK